MGEDWRRLIGGVVGALVFPAVMVAFAGSGVPFHVAAGFEPWLAALTVAMFWAGWQAGGLGE